MSSNYKGVIFFLSLIFATGCAKKPDVKVAHGADRNLFKKSELLGGPYELNLLPESSSQLALASQVEDESSIEFLIEERLLHVFKIEGTKKKPYLVYDILQHVDLVREKDKNGHETQFLVPSTVENADWKLRQYIEVNPASFKEVKIAYGEDKNLFSKSDLSDLPLDPRRVSGPASRLVVTAIEENIKLVSFDVGKHILNLYRIEKGQKIPYLQFSISGHFDLRQPKDAEGRLGVFLEKDDLYESHWEKRQYIEVDPYDVKKVDFEKLKAESELNLFSVNFLDDAKFVFGTDKIPGIDEKLQVQLSSELGLKVGDVLYAKLTRSKLYLKKIDTSGSEVIVAEIGVSYFDLTQTQNSNYEETHEFKLDQLKRSWNDRQYVMISPDSGAIESQETELLDKTLLDKCYDEDKIPVPEIRSQVAGKGAKFCFNFSESYLSVYSESVTDRNLVAVYGIREHLNIVDRNYKENDIPATWDKKRYVVISSKNPELPKNLVRPNALKKNVLGGEFIYVTTIQKSHSEAGGRLIPGMRNVLEGKIKFEFSENKVTAYRTKETLNSNTKTPVLRFSTEQFTVERIKNSIGDRTSTIAETRERDWSEETHFRAAFGGNEIPGYFNEYLGLEKIYYRSHILSQSRLTGDVEISPDGLITFFTEEVLTPNASAGNFGEGETILEPKSVLMRHSFLPVKNSSYQAKEYSARDFKTFGFFRTMEYQLDANGRPTDDTVTAFINRFDLSDGKTIKYTVNKEFPEKYWDIATKAVGEWNDALKNAIGRQSDVVVLERNSGEDYSDPRVNMIAYIPDRIITGILGFGPMIQNPETGEILSSQTYLYDAVFKSVREHLDHVYDYVKAQLPSEDKSTAISGSDVTAGELERFINGRRTQSTSSAWDLAEDLSKPDYDKIVGSMSQVARGEITARVSDWGGVFSKVSENLNASLPSQLTQDLNDVGRQIVSNSAQSARLFNIPQCFYEADSQLSSALKFIRLNKDKSKEEVLDILEKQSVYTTLLHELGHNFGLRHNFFGSFDEANFGKEYAALKKEIEAGSSDSESSDRFLEMWKSSTVMDYITNFEEQFTGIGEYDKAAIAYGYGDLIEAKKNPASSEPPSVGEYHWISKNVLQQIIDGTAAANPGAPLDLVERFVKNSFGVRSYMFCTDEHVDNDPTCNRHDSGLTVQEIVQSLISDYELNYILYSARNNRRAFTGNSSFVLSRYFLPIRQAFDEFVYKLVTDSFSGTTGPGGQQDYINALITGINFFFEVVKTPENGTYHFDDRKKIFVLGEKEGSKKLVVTEGLGKKLMPLYGDINGQDVAVKRGHIFDKLAAMMALTLRGFPAEKYQKASLTVNYYDFDIFRSPLFETFSEMMQGKLTFPSKAVFVESMNSYVAVPIGVLDQLSPDMEVLDVKIESSANNIVEDYSMIFAVADFNNDSDQTFMDYVDFKIVGEDDQSIPSDIDTVRFLSANGTKEYVVPQTVDGRSIAYNIAKDAPEVSRSYHEAMRFLNDPAKKSELSSLLEAAFPEVLAQFKLLWAKVQGGELPANIEEILSSDKESGLDRMLDLTDSVLSDYKQTLASAESEGNEEDVKRLKDLVEFVSERKILSETAVNNYKVLNDQFTEYQSKSSSLKSNLIQIESRLLKIKKYYNILN